MLNPNNLIITQELIRNLDSILYWGKRINTTDNFEYIPKVKLTRFKDSPGLYIHDGHTRLIACSLTNYVLSPEEYDITEYKIEEYMSVNLARKYVTPFNPITHVRYSDFFHVKQFIIKQVEQNRLAISDIPKLSCLYSRPRRITFLHELAAKYKPLIESIK